MEGMWVGFVVFMLDEYLFVEQLRIPIIHVDVWVCCM